MNIKEKIKRAVLVTLGLGLSTYFLYSGFSILFDKGNPTSKIHSNTVK